MTRLPKVDAPICRVCGHEPCPGCENWCDILLRIVYCPQCDSPLGEWAEHDVSCTCLACKSEGTMRREDTEVELCCDGECDFDWSEERVAQWCAKERVT